MAENVTFRGTVLKHMDLRQGKEGGDVFVRIHMSADYSEQVREKMGWERIPDTICDAKLTGELLATHLILTPGDKQLRNHELNFDITSVEDFQVVPLRNDDGDITGRELRFIVRTPAEVEGFLGQYIRRVGRHAGALKVSYTVQGALDLNETKGPSLVTKGASTETQEPGPETKPEAEETGADTGCIFCNNDLPFEDREKSTHANGMECTRESGASTLASAREAAGGTHARGKRRPPAADPGPVITDEEAAAIVN